MSNFKNKVMAQNRNVFNKIRHIEQTSPKNFLTKEEFSYSEEDASRYASKYYGDIYRQTTRYDNDWD